MTNRRVEEIKEGIRILQGRPMQPEVADLVRDVEDLLRYQSALKRSLLAVTAVLQMETPEK